MLPTILGLILLLAELISRLPTSAQDEVAPTLTITYPGSPKPYNPSGVFGWVKCELASPPKTSCMLKLESEVSSLESHSCVYSTTDKVWRITLGEYFGEKHDGKDVVCVATFESGTVKRSKPYTFHALQYPKPVLELPKGPYVEYAPPVDFKCTSTMPKQRGDYPLRFKINSKRKAPTDPGEYDGTKYTAIYKYQANRTDDFTPVICEAGFSGIYIKSVTLYITIITPPLKPVISGPGTVADRKPNQWKCEVKDGSEKHPTVKWKLGNGTEMSGMSTELSPVNSRYRIRTYPVSNILKKSFPISQPDVDLICFFTHDPTAAAKIPWGREAKLSIKVVCCVPEINCPNRTLAVGEKLSCTCTMKGMEKPYEITWPGQSDTAELNFDHITSKDDGKRFYCNVKKGDTNIKSDKYILRVEKEIPEDDDDSDNATTPAANDTEPEDENIPDASSYWTAVIIGAIGVLVFLAVAGGLYWFSRKRKAASSKSADPKETEASIPKLTGSTASGTETAAGTSEEAISGNDQDSPSMSKTENKVEGSSTVD